MQIYSIVFYYFFNYFLPLHRHQYLYRGICGFVKIRLLIFKGQLNCNVQYALTKIICNTLFNSYNIYILLLVDNCK